MAVKPISISVLEDQFVCGCAEERTSDAAPVPMPAPRASSFRQRAHDRRETRSAATGRRLRSSG